MDAAVVRFFVTGAAAQRRYTSRMRSDPFGRAKYASSFAKSAIESFPSDPIHFEVNRRRGAGMACPDVSVWSVRARRCTESDRPNPNRVRTSMPPSAVRRMSDGSGAGSSSPSETSAAHVASTIATASSQETEMPRASTVSSASGSDVSNAPNGVSNSGAGVLAANRPAVDGPAADGPAINGRAAHGPAVDRPAVNGPAANGPAATELPPCIEEADSASNCARGSSSPAAARVLGFKIGSAI